MSAHKNVFTALTAAQGEMGPLVKGAVNPYFKSRYATLDDVVNAVRPPLNSNGLCFHFETQAGEMVAVLTHGESETSIRCGVPLLVSKNDIQAFKSAATYAKRIGLESLSGVAPEDDDGNAAAAAPIQRPAERQAPARISADQFIALTARMEAAGVPEDKICARYSLRSIEEMPAEAFQKAMGALQKTIDDKKPARADLEDEIPY